MKFQKRVKKITVNLFYNHFNFKLKPSQDLILKYILVEYATIFRSNPVYLDNGVSKKDRTGTGTKSILLPNAV